MEWPDIWGGSGRTDWGARRAELMALFASEVYGPEPPSVVASVSEWRDEPLFSGAARLRTGTVDAGALGKFTRLLVTPAGDGPFPVVLGLSFDGLAETSRSERWQFEMAARRGWAVATACYEEIAPDRASGLIYGGGFRAISLWASGMSRLLDTLLIDPTIDGTRVMACGHSRLGKTALLAGARDTRFAGVIANQSGCGGAAPSRGTVGESVERITSVFPHWFCDRFAEHGADPSTLPIDQHALVACCAPRPVLLTNAVDDTWANPGGQFETLVAADDVYQKIVGDGLRTHTMPGVGDSTLGRLGYALRAGGHSVLPEDWKVWLDWAESQWG